MINKITAGKNVDGLATYLTDERCRPPKTIRILRTAGFLPFKSNTLSEIKEKVNTTFQRQASLRPRVKNPVRHISLEFLPDDKKVALQVCIGAVFKRERIPLNRHGAFFQDRILQKTKEGKTEEAPFDENEMDHIFADFMLFIALEYMRMMGILDTQYMIVEHKDKKHPHIHILWNQVTNTGNVIKTYKERSRGVKVCRELTEKYGLTLGLGKGVRRHRNLHREYDMARYTISQDVFEALTLVTFEDLEEELPRLLKKKGITTKFHRDDAGEAYGISFERGSMAFSGRKLDRLLSYRQICIQSKRNSYIKTLQNNERQSTHSLGQGNTSASFRRNYAEPGNGRHR